MITFSCVWLSPSLPHPLFVFDVDLMLSTVLTGVDEDVSAPESTDDAPAASDMPPLEDDEDDASRMEEVD